MADMNDKMSDTKDEAGEKMQDMKVDAKARMTQMREENSQHSANEE